MGMIWSRCRRPSRWSCVVPLVDRVSLASGDRSVLPPSKRISRCPDVIEAHEKYERGPLPVADVWTCIPRPLPPRPPPPPPPVSFTTPENKITLNNGDGRKLSTQHHHPLNSISEQLSQKTISETGNPNLQYRRHQTAPVIVGALKVSQKQSCFGYDIRDVDSFLAEASLERPANIPMVLCRAAPLFRHSKPSNGDIENCSPAPQLMLPLGMVVNGVFRQNSWLYAQTPHGHEGFIRYAACLPLGILPPSHNSTNSEVAPPCWESASDVFPQPRGYSGVGGGAGSRTRSERAFGESKKPRRSRRPVLHEAERGLDKLYLKALQQRYSPPSHSSHIQHDFGFV